MCKQMRFYLSLICFLAFFKNASALPEESELLLEDPKRPTKEISNGLGISQKEFIECFKNVIVQQNLVSHPNIFSYLSLKPLPEQLVNLS